MAITAVRIRIGCWLRVWEKVSAVPWKPPRTLVGMPISASAWAMAALASLSDLPSARLNEIVVASTPSWWLIAAGVARLPMVAKLASGIIRRGAVLIALPVAWSRAPGLAEAVAAVPLAAVAPPAPEFVPPRLLEAWLALTAWA